MTKGNKSNRDHNHNKVNMDKINILGKSIFLYMSFVFIILFLIGKVVYLKVAKGSEYEKRARSQQTNQINKILSPIRGSILDRNGQEIAKSNIVYKTILDTQVMMDRIESNRENDKTEIMVDETGEEVVIDIKEQTIADLSGLTNVSSDEIRSKMDPKSETGNKLTYSRYDRIGKTEISKTAHDEFIERRKWPWVWFEDSSKRIYPYNSSACYLIGFTGKDQGASGIELQYNDYLTGTPGRSFITYSSGNSKENNIINAQNGNTIVTTIDMNIQQIAEETVANAMKNSKPVNAAVIVMNPNTGEILAMTSYPGFDLNDPYSLAPLGLDETTLTDTEVSDERSKLWRNFNISDTYEPGSTFKAVTIAAGLEEGVIKENEPFYCGGYKNFKGLDDPIRCWYRWNSGGHGGETLEQALANSCNVVMMDIGIRLGKEKFYKYLRDFGFGEPTKIDLPGEPTSYSTLVRNLEQISDIDLANMSFGQSFNCTPLQLLNAFAAVINGGNLMKPYVVSKILDGQNNLVVQNEPSIERKVISEETSSTLRQYLEAVVDTGTGKKLKIDGYTIGGKTGTAQQGKKINKLNENVYILSFAAFLPVDNPEILALAILDQPEEKDEGSAAPMLKELLEKIITYLGLEPDVSTNGLDHPLEETFVVIDDYTGMEAMEAVSSLSMLDVPFEIIGSGSIVDRQFPQGGTEMKASSKEAKTASDEVIQSQVNSKVTLWLKKNEAAQKVTVPYLIDLTYDEANELLKSLGIVTVVEGSQEGKVIEQTPKDGAIIDSGGSVTIKFQK